MSARWYKIWMGATSGLWLIPVVCVVCVVIGVMIALGTIALDRANDDELVSPDIVRTPDAVLAILQTVAASMVSLTALVLTIVLVVVQLAMGQFSPRIVQRLLRDRPSQPDIGLLVATFVHSLLAIREVDLGSTDRPGHVPGVAVIATFALALASIAVLVSTSTTWVRPCGFPPWWSWRVTRPGGWSTGSTRTRVTPTRTSRTPPS